MIPFVRRSDGVRLTLSAGERAVLADLAGQLEQILAGDVQGDPVAARLFPSAYPGDAEASEEFRRYTFGDLLDAKAANVRVVHEWVVGEREGPFGPSDEQAWLRCLTDLRLTIAQRLGIVDDDPVGAEATVGSASPGGLGLREVYDWLGYVQEHLVQTIDGGLDPR